MDCIFCKIVNGEIPSKKIYEDEHVIGIFDLHPSSNMHTLIIPKKHIEDLMEMDNKTLGYINDAVKKITPLLIEKAKAKSFALRVNYLDLQEIKHYHMHLLPDYGKKVSISQDKAYEIFKN